MATCKTCGKKCEGDYCFSHKPRKKMSIKKLNKVVTHQRSYNDSHRKISKLVTAEKTRQFFDYIWRNRRHISEVSGGYLGREASSAYFHHILAKSKYPELAYIEENIILLTLDEHANVESDMYKYEEVNKRREKLINKYLNHE